LVPLKKEKKKSLEAHHNSGTYYRSYTDELRLNCLGSLGVYLKRSEVSEKSLYTSENHYIENFQKIKINERKKSKMSARTNKNIAHQNVKSRTRDSWFRLFISLQKKKKKNPKKKRKK